MAIIRCPNGHNYDSTLYRKCPICETEAAYGISAAYDKTIKLKDADDEPTRKLCGADDEKTIFNALSDYESSDGLNGISYLDHNQFAYCLNNPINLTDPSGKRAINITSKLTNLMRSNALKFAAYIMGQIIFRGVVRGMVNAFKYFYNNSKNGGSWDLKRLPSWKLSKGDWFVFRGKRLRNDDPGNIHFGYVGSVMFPVHILRAGAGVYQIYSGTSKWKYWWSFFDDPRDSAMISYGNTLFKADILKSIIRILKAGNRFRIYWI